MRRRNKSPFCSSCVVAYHHPTRVSTNGACHHLAIPPHHPIPPAQTYGEVKKQVDALGAALTAVGVSAGDRVGVYGANSPYWMKAMQACNRQSAWCIPLYDTLGENAIEYIVNHAEGVCIKGHCV